MLALIALAGTVSAALEPGITIEALAFDGTTPTKFLVSGIEENAVVVFNGGFDHHMDYTATEIGIKGCLTAGGEFNDIDVHELNGFVYLTFPSGQGVALYNATGTRLAPEHDNSIDIEFQGDQLLLIRQ
jgi:hypothetical protein